MRISNPFLICTAVALISGIGLQRAAADNFAPYVTTPFDESDLAWMEQGLNSAAPTDGLPHAGVIHGLTDPSSTFLLQPYTGNNVFFLSRQVSTIAPPPTKLNGTITFATPTPALSLAFAASSSDGDTFNTLTVHFADQTPDATVMLNVDDWAKSTPMYATGIVATSNGRVVVHPLPNYEFFSEPLHIWEDVVQLPETAPHPISSIDVHLGNYRLGIFGVSASLGTSGPYTSVDLTASSFNQDVVVEASALPEPAALGLVATCASALLVRRRRSIGRAQCEQLPPHVPAFPSTAFPHSGHTPLVFPARLYEHSRQ